MLDEPYLPVARRRSVVGAVERLQRSQTVIVFGAAGVGKTYVGGLIARRLLLAGARVARIRPTSTGTGILFGAVYDSGPEDYPLQPMRSFLPEALAEVLAAAGGPQVIHVDDAHLFDEQRIRWLIATAERNAVTLMAAVSTEDGPGVPGAALLTRLWVDGNAARIDLDTLTQSETSKMIGFLVAGATVDRATQLAVHRSAGGLPVLIRELVRDVLQNGTQSGVSATFVYPLPQLPSKRIIDIVWYRLRTLSDHERSALVVLARLGSIPYARASNYVGEATLRALTAAGFTDHDETTDAVRTARAIESEVVLAVGGAAQMARISLRVAKIMRSDLQAGIQLRPLEYVLLAETMLGDEHTPAYRPDVTDAEEIASIFVTAAAKCAAVGTIYSGLSFARAASEAHPSVAALVEESRCLCAMGYRQAAVDALRPADRMTADEFETRALERWRVALDSWTAPATTANVGAQREDSVRGAMRAALSFDWDEAAAVSESVGRSGTVDALTRLQALGVLVVCCAQAADGARLNSAILLGESIIAGLEWSGTYQEIIGQAELDAYRSFLAAAQLISGVDVEEVIAQIDGWTVDALDRHDFARLAVLGALSGFADLCRGDAESAETEFRLATNRMRAIPDARWEVWIPGLRSHSLLIAGRHDDARDVLDRLEEEYPPDSLLRRYAREWVSTELRGDRVQLSATSHRPEESTLVTADRSINGRLTAMMSAVASGVDAEPLANQADELRSCTDLPLLHARADFVLATARQDGAMLAATARAFASVGYFAAATAAAASSAKVYTSAGSVGAAASSEALGRDFRARGLLRHGATAPAIDLSALTPRERQIVTLVAQGRTNRQVADALYLSVRTVESHFYQASMKLGGVSRRQLARYSDVDES